MRRGMGGWAVSLFSAECPHYTRSAAASRRRVNFFSIFRRLRKAGLAEPSVDEEPDAQHDEPEQAHADAGVPVAGPLGEDGDAGQDQGQFDPQLAEVEVE